MLQTVVAMMQVMYVMRMRDEHLAGGICKARHIIIVCFTFFLTDLFNISNSLIVTDLSNCHSASCFVYI